MQARAVPRGQSLEVEHKDRHERVFARNGETVIRTANFASSSSDGKELRENLDAARKKPVRTAIGGQVWILKVGVYDSFGENAFRVLIDPAPKLDPSARRRSRRTGSYSWRSFTTTLRSTAGRLRNWTFSGSFILRRRPFTR